MPLPSGTVTFLFSDIEGSTRLARALPPEEWSALLRTHDSLVDDAIARHQGSIVKHEGDGAFAVFSTASNALAAADRLTRTLVAQARPGGVPLRVRIGIHTGDGRLTDAGADYVGVDVHYTARLAAAGNGGQILVSEATRLALNRDLPEDDVLVSAGPRRLKDFDEPRPIHRLVVPGAADDARPLRAAVGVDLPPELTAFVGRTSEIAAVSELLERSRIVTLTGPGGTGKTRLAIGITEQVIDHYEDGGVFVELAPVHDPALVPAAVAARLGIAEQPGQSAAELVTGHLADKRMLLVLDNLEQLLPDAAGTVAAFVRAGTGVRVLSASREPLRIAGEQEFQVPPLGQAEAEALFMDRARLVRADFEPSASEAAAVAGIAARLEGLPLAIELAAARVKVFPPSGILDRLERSLDLLTSGSRDLPERQRTLRGAIAWSYDLLPDPEQLLFRRLAVLVGSWTSESADRIANDDHELGLDTLDGLVSLVDKSLLRVVPSEHGDPLFGRHAFVREFAWERLAASGELDRCQRRHARVFRDLAIRVGDSLTSAGGSQLIHLLDHAAHDLRQAMTWALESGEVEVGLMVIGSAWRWWQIRAHLREGRAWAERLLAHPNAAEDSIGRMRGLAALGGLAYWSTDYPTTRRAYVERLALAERIADPRELAEAHYDLSFVGVVEKDLELHRKEAELALAGFTALDDRPGIIRARQALVLAEYLGGNPVAARELEMWNLADFRSTQSWYRVADSLMLLSALERSSGRYDVALATARDALRTMPERVGGSTLGALGVIAIVQGESGDVELAARLTGAIAAIQSETGEALAPVSVLHLPHPETVVRGRLAGDVADRLIAEGRLLTPEEAIALALGDAEARTPIS